MKLDVALCTLRVRAILFLRRLRAGRIKLSKKDLLLRDLIRKGEWEEDSPCNHCGSKETRPYLTNENKEWYGRVFELVQCPNCYLVYANPRPSFDSILNFCLNSDWSEQMRIRKLKRRKVREFHRSVIKDALRYNKDARSLFDIGTGAGTILLEAREMGLKVAGNDINRASCRWLNGEGIKTYNIPTNDLEIEDKFDIITMLDYIEHTYTPFDDLKWAYKHLNDDGILYLETLYLNCPTHKGMGKSWHLFGEGHFYYYYEFVLVNMICHAGFTVIEETLRPSVIQIIARKR